MICISSEVYMFFFMEKISRSVQRKGVFSMETYKFLS